MPKLLILGGGYGGLAVAQKLDSLSRGQSQWDITLVDQRDYHLLQVRVHEVAANTIPAERVRIPFTELLEGRNIKFVQTEIQIIDPQAKTVQTGAGALEYDRLVVAMGSETAYRNIPGLREYTFPMKELEDAINYRKAVIEAFKAAKNADPPLKPNDERLTFVIGGGGLTGTELAGEMIDFCSELAKRAGLERSSFRIVLIEAAPVLLPQLSRQYGEYVRNELRSRGVIVATNTFIDKVEEGIVYLKGGKLIRSKVIAWAGGIQAPPLLAASGFVVGKDGRVTTDEFLRSRQYPDVYVIGDAANVPDNRTGGAVPWTAQYAEREGHYLAENLWDEERGIRPHPYLPFSLGTAISLGRSEALTISGPLKLTGVPGRLAKNVSYDNYEWNIRYRPRILKA
ncbi:MAG TPA: NAD(P)/FAD-dependent oxidoreductase [Chloroflexia bacterium]|nr:NAD(P)/FAD-dependent oxidoreductase [Chloroflexia bacterium]